MKKLIIPCTTLMIFLLFTTSFIGNKTNLVRPYLPSDTLQYAVIKFHKSDSSLFKNAKPTYLTYKEIKSAELILAMAMDSYNHGTKGYGRLSSIFDYKVQFVPVINSKGEKEIWMNCFCMDDGLNWRKVIIEVDDGGPCFFNLKINLKTKAFYDMSVNGEA